MIRIFNMGKIINTKTWYIALLLLFFLFSYILPLGTRDLIAPDETRYAEIPREMIAGRDWVVPHLNGVRYFEKPVLGYWVNACSILLLGENNFAVRFPSALSTGLSALLIYVFVRRAYRRKDHGECDDFAAILASFIFLSCFEVFGVGNTALLDNLFSFFMTASISAFYFASENLPGSTKEKYLLALAGLACGLAFLTKGFVAFAIPVSSLATYLVWQRRYSDLLRMSWLPILFAILVILPWAIAIYIREPGYWSFFVWNEHVRRFMADNAQHKESFLYFFMIAPAAFFPWTFLSPAAVTGINELLASHGTQDRLLKFCICWLALPFLFFSFANGKLLTYILPCFPPFAVLMSIGLLHALKKNVHNRLFQIGTAGSTMLFAMLLVVFSYIQFFGFNGSRLYEQPWRAMMIINGLVFFIIFCIWALKSKRAENKTILYAVAPLIFFFVIHYAIPDLGVDTTSPRVMLQQYEQNVGGRDIIISDEDSIRDVCWYFQSDRVYLLGEPGELGYGLGYKDAHGRLLDRKSAVALINQNRGRTLLFARTDNMNQWRDKLPKPVVQATDGRYRYVLLRY